MGNNCAAAVFLSNRRHGIGLAITDVACDGTLMADCIAMHRGVRFSRFQSAVYQWCAAVNSDCVNVVKTRRGVFCNVTWFCSCLVDTAVGLYKIRFVKSISYMIRYYEEIR